MPVLVLYTYAYHRQRGHTENVVLQRNGAESPGITGRINYRVLNTSVAQVILNQPGVTAVVCQRITTSMPEHVRVNSNINSCTLPVFTEQRVQLLPGQPPPVPG